jgi:hypothetical protein
VLYQWLPYISHLLLLMITPFSLAPDVISHDFVFHGSRRTGYTMCVLCLCMCVCTCIHTCIYLWRYIVYMSSRLYHICFILWWNHLSMPFSKCIPASKWCMTMSFSTCIYAYIYAYIYTHIHIYVYPEHTRIEYFMIIERSGSK